MYVWPRFQKQLADESQAREASSESVSIMKSSVAKLRLKNAKYNEETEAIEVPTPLSMTMNQTPTFTHDCATPSSVQHKLHDIQSRGVPSHSALVELAKVCVCVCVCVFVCAKSVHRTTNGSQHNHTTAQKIDAMEAEVAEVSQKLKAFADLPPVRLLRKVRCRCSRYTLLGG